MEKENVIQKIQKLLKLQYGAESIGSTGEAFQAAKMVQKLLMEYNLSMSDIDTSDGQDIDIHLPTNSDKYMLVIRDHVSPDPDYQLISRLKYVHKLQHALKEYKYEKITIKL